VPHIEFTREIARRFNHMYGREPGFEDKAREAVKKLGGKRASSTKNCARAIQQDGDDEALERPMRCSTRRRASVWATANGCSVPRRRRQDDPGRAGRAADRGRRACPVWTARRCPSPTTTPSCCARSAEVGDARRSAHADRSGAGASHRSGRPGQVPGVAVPPGLFGRRYEAVGAAGLPQRRHRLHRMQAAGDRRRAQGAGADARTGETVLDDPTCWCATSSPTAASGPQARPETMRDVREAMGLNYA
jgi:hypothetical protein